MGGRLSLGAEIVKKAGLWICNLFVKYWTNKFCNILLYEVVDELKSHLFLVHFSV